MNAAQQIIAALHRIAGHLSDIEVQLATLNCFLEEGGQENDATEVEPSLPLHEVGPCG